MNQMIFYKKGDNSMCRLNGKEPGQKVRRGENRDSFIGAELEQVGVAGHQAVGAAAVSTGQEVIIIRIVLDHGGCFVRLHELCELPEGLLDLHELRVGQTVHRPEAGIVQHADIVVARRRVRVSRRC